MAQIDAESMSPRQENHQPQQQQQEINSIQVMKQTGGQLPSIDEQKTLRDPPSPKLPRSNLTNEPREVYLKIGIPLYEASISCDWKAAKAIFDLHPELVKSSITGNGETALHIAASAKGPKHVEEFVRNLVALMTDADLELQNNNHNTALYLAVAAGNIKTVKIMVERNSALVTIAGSNGTMMPLYTAVLFGNEDVAKYLYNKSQKLSDKGWTSQTRGWLVQKCAENDMFDVALEIVKTYPDLCNGNVLGVLARKPEAFPETEFSFISRTINWAKHIYSKMLITPQPSPNEHPEVGSESGPTKLSQCFEPSPNAHTEVGSESGPIELSQSSEPSPNEHSEVDIESGPRKLSQTSEPSPNEHPEVGSESGPTELSQSSEPSPNEHPEVGIESGPTKLSQSSEPFPNEHPEVGSESGPTKLSQSSEPSPNERPEVGNKSGPTELSQSSEPFPDTKSNIISSVCKFFGPNGGCHEKEAYALILLRTVWGEIAKKATKEIDHMIRGPLDEKQNATSSVNSKRKYSSRILFVAAEMGNTKFLVELIRQYPDLIWKVNDDGLSIFHIAVKHRHEGIYNLLYEIGSMKDLITPLKDEDGNTMLHLVGKIAKQKRLEDVSGVALQMQRELLWFKEVEAMIPPSYRERKNKRGETPYELFTREHKDLVTNGEKWMKDTASQCMVVATLIATIVFAVAFTVPGGYNQISREQNGIPVFHSKTTFKIFVVADAISLFASTASILMFLSILTSRYAERDFLESLPKKLMLGLATLFLSITTMTITFSISFFVLYHKGLIWMPIIISAFAVSPVLLYMVLQCGLFFDIIRSTYGSRYLFKPQKQVLYYKNPNI